MILVFYSTFAPTAQHLATLRSLAGNEPVHVAENEADAIAHAPNARIVLGHRYLRQILPHVTRLEWVQSTAAGVDILQAPALLKQNVIVSRCPANSEAIAQHALALAWALQRRLPEYVQAQTAGHWLTPTRMAPLPRTALVLGLGSIGQQLARLLRGLGIHVRGTARTANPEKITSCDEYLSPDKWHGALPDTDLLFACLPLTDSTRQQLNRAALAQLPAHAVLVNLGRQGLLDLPALLDALQQGRLWGAALDGLDPIPPANSPVWQTPGLLITPKVSAHHPGMQANVEQFIEQQLSRYLHRRPLQAIVSHADLCATWPGTTQDTTA